MVYDVYGNGRCQYDRNGSLSAEIVRAWERIPLSKLDTLISTMPRCCLVVIKNTGSKVNYKEVIGQWIMNFHCFMGQYPLLSYATVVSHFLYFNFILIIGYLI